MLQDTMFRRWHLIGAVAAAIIPLFMILAGCQDGGTGAAANAGITGTTVKTPEQRIADIKGNARIPAAAKEAAIESIRKHQGVAGNSKP